ncbi:phosphate/phosphite/phosphonate ABC transporter substrate-binding protein [Thiocystis violascens]|nr:phosphate/phosphite/phosphonate ABC transporter substrate-binding protein [Thiocystis violascens]
MFSPFAVRAEALFRLGVINERPERPSEAIAQYGPLNEYLRQKLNARGIRVGDLVIARDIDEIVQRIDAGDVDAFIEGVMPTLTVQKRTDKISPRLLIWRKGQRQYHTVFFVRRDSPIDSLQALRGKTIVFESERSTSAYFVPRAVLRAEGLHVAPAERLGSTPAAVGYRFAGSELNQAYWVRAGRVEAGAFNDGDWERVPASIRDDLRIIDRTRPILRWLFSVVTSLEPWVQTAVLEVLTDMHRDPLGQAALDAAERIAKLEDLTDEDRANLAYWSNALFAPD